MTRDYAVLLGVIERSGEEWTLLRMPRGDVVRLPSHRVESVLDALGLVPVTAEDAP